MSASANLVDSLGDSTDHSVPLLAQEQSQPIHEQTNPSAGDASQDLEGPPVYQHPSFFAGEKHDSTQMLAEQPSNPTATVTAFPVSAPVLSTSTEMAWYETLRELQENIADLRIAKGRASRLSTFARMAPNSFRTRSLRGADESERDVRVLEELVLAGMRRLSHIHPDPLVQAEWDSRAEEFSRSLRSSDGDTTEGRIALSGAEDAASGDLEGARAQRFGRRSVRLFTNTDKDTPLMGLAKGLGIVLFAPVAMAGALAFGTGAMLYGTGKMIVGLGHLMTFGKLR